VADGFRLRVRFQKAGRLRFLSHLEVARALERAVRRAGLPYAVSQGFTPRMRLSFGPALPVGTASACEYLDVLLGRFVPLEEAFEALCRSTPDDLAPLASGYVAPSEPSLGVALTVATYDVRMERGMPLQEGAQALRTLLETGTMSVDHKGKTKVFDLSRVLPKEPTVRVSEGVPTLEVAVRMGDAGSLRPEAIVGATFGEKVAPVVTRTGLYIEGTEGWRAPL